MIEPHPIDTDFIAPEDSLKFPPEIEKGGYNTESICGCKFYHNFGRALTYHTTCTIKNFMPCEKHQKAPINYECGCHIDRDDYVRNQISDYRELHTCEMHRWQLYESHW